MRDLSKYPVTPEEMLRTLDRVIAEEMNKEQKFGDISLVALRTIRAHVENIN